MFFAVAYCVMVQKGRMSTVEVDDRIYTDLPTSDDLARFADELSADIVRLYRVGKHRRPILVEEYVNRGEQGE